MEEAMSRKMLGTVVITVLLSMVGLANAKEPLKLNDRQLQKVTAGAFNLQQPIAASFLANGTNGGGGTNFFSPSTATVAQTQTVLGLNLFTVH
jgi:hypothetical protein